MKHRRLEPHEEGLVISEDSPSPLRAKGGVISFGAVAQNPFRSLKRIFDRRSFVPKTRHPSSNAGFATVSLH